MKKLFVILPCYNEEKDIAPLVEKWAAMIDAVNQKGYITQIYCIDDKSKDHTNKIIRALADKYADSVHLIEHKVNKGLGGVLQTGFDFFYANGKKGDICVLMDGDNTHDPVYVISMLEKIAKGYDCVIASRYCGQSKTKGVSPFRLFLSWGARFYYTLVLGVRGVKDYTCGYRAYTYQIIAKAESKFGRQFVEHRSFACMMEVLYKLSLAGAKFAEVPFELRYDNKEGESKMHIAKTVRESLITALKLRMKKRKYMREII